MGLNIFKDIYDLGDENIIPGNLTYQQVKKFLTAKNEEAIRLFSIAREIRDSIWGKHCFLRAVIEVSNFCNNNCKYCSMQKKNYELNRFLLTKEELKETINNVKKQGIKTIMLQGGECEATFNLILNTLEDIKSNKLHFAVCIGNLSLIKLKMLQQMGVEGYIHKFETLNSSLHSDLRNKSLNSRLKCLTDIKYTNLQAGSGNILGLPDQSINDLVKDLLFLQYKKLPMNSVSPFIPSKGTELEKAQIAPLQLTLNFIALMRIANPSSLIPSVSALKIIDVNGQSCGLEAGANVLTVNFTPSKYRKYYTIYNDNRYIVEAHYAQKIAKENNLEINKNYSLGPKFLNSREEKKWFDFRYNNNNLDHSVYGTTTDFFEKYVITKLNPADSIIDLGGGDGRLSIPIAKKIKKAISVDLSLSANIRLKKRIDYFQINNIVTLHDNIFNLTGDEQYDFVINSNLIYYFDIDKLQNIFNLSTNLLKKGGFLYLCFESCIIMSIKENIYFSLRNIFNYTNEDIIDFLNTQNDMRIINYACSSKIRELAINALSISDSNIYKRFYYLHEFLIQKN